MLRHLITITILYCIVFAGNIYAQEQVAPLLYNAAVANARATSPAAAYKTTALSLPFFEDFTDYSPFPDGNKWEGRYVYINNTMGNNPISRGVATFDALNEYGMPYSPTNSKVLLYADTLTCKGIDLSLNNPGDSIYLSFFYQPQGNGFYPETSDSLILYLKRKNKIWVKAWAKEGTQLLPFTQVMIPVRDTGYFFEDFQFRFINKASINTNDDVWNVDYIRMATGRNMYDTLVNDIAMSADPTFLLNDYTSMPYHQFLANPSKEMAAQHNASISNNTTNAEAVDVYFSAKERMTSIPLGSEGPVSATIKAGGQVSVVFNNYSTTIPNVKKYDWVSYDNTYYLNQTGATGNKVNDTIVKSQGFHNFLAYDDGTAEKSYFLNLFPTLPGKLAIEYHLNQPDTLTGIAIYFGKQVPSGSNKYFSAVVYSSIAVNGGSDNVVYQQDFLDPGYMNTNYYYFYRFDNPVPLNAGTFYMGTLQPALSNSDSLYFGLDANRETSNHAYYNVVGKWEGSTIKGAVMVRPMFGKFFPSDVSDIQPRENSWNIYPNPVTDVLHMSIANATQHAYYEMTNMSGKKILSGTAIDNQQVDISGLLPGLYLLRMTIDGHVYAPKKIIKL
jgi:hypothetical protein